jgi:hypothetical protein
MIVFTTDNDNYAVVKEKYLITDCKALNNFNFPDTSY